MSSNERQQEKDVIDRSRGPYEHRKFIERVLILVGIGLALLLLWTLLDLLVLVFGAVVIAVLFRAVADPIARHTPLGDRGSATVAVLLVAGILGLFGWAFGAQVRSEFTGLSQTLPAAWHDFQQRLDGLPFGSGLGVSLENFGPSGTNIVSRLGDLAMTLGSAATDFILVVFGAIFLAANPQLYKRGLIKLVPRRGRALAGEALADSGRALKLWLMGQLVAMLLVGLLTWLGLWLIDLPAALALALTAGFLEIIPYVGPVLAAIPGMLLALLISPEMALWTLFVYFGVQQLEAVLITPLIQGKAVTLPPALTVFGVVAAGIMFGFVGLIFAAPLLVVAYVLVKKLYVREALDTDTPLPGEPEEA